MRPTTLGLALLAGLVLIAGYATAEENATRTNESEQAWVDDCPPDHMCAMNESAEEDATDENASKDPECESCRGGGNATDEPTYPGDCGGEVCAYQDPNEPASSDDPADAGSNCMDGEQGDESCRDDVQYMTPPDDGREPATDSTQEAAAISTPADGSEGHSVPGFGFIALAGALGAALAIVAPARRK